MSGFKPRGETASTGATKLGGQHALDRDQIDQRTVIGKFDQAIDVGTLSCSATRHRTEHANANHAARLQRGTDALDGCQCLRQGDHANSLARVCGRPAYRFIASTSTPAPTMAMPSQSRPDGRSCRNTTANSTTSTRLSLSTGATLDASPTFSARK